MRRNYLKIAAKIAVLTIIMTMSLTLSSCAEQTNPQDSDQDPYVTAPLTATAIKTSLTYTSTQAATVVPRSVQNLYFDGVSGTLTTVYAGANEFVKQGDALAEIDPSEQLASIERSEIDMRILEIRKQQRELEGLTFEAAFITARDEYSKAANEYRRNKTDDNMKSADKAQAKYIQAAYGKETFELNTKISDLDYEKAHQSHKKLVENLENCVMTAPSDGVIISVSELGIGGRMSSNDTFFSFVTTADLLLSIRSRNVMYLHGEEDIRVAINGIAYEAYAYKPVRGDAIWAADPPMTQLYVAFKTATPDVVPGITVSANITVEKADVLAIPRRCIRNIDGMTTVDILRGEQLDTVPVTIGIVSGNLIEITSGLIEGDIVLAE